MNFSKLKHNLYLYKYNILKPGSVTYYHQLLQNQKLSPDELRVLQKTKRDNLLHFALKNSSFYQEKYHSIDMENLLQEDKFENIPVLSREEVQSNAATILTEDTSRCNKITTGGSTGHPLTVYHPRHVNRAAALWRMFSWWGLHPGENRGTVYRETAESFSAKVKDAIIEWPSSHQTLNATNINEQSIQTWIALCNKTQPGIVHGYVGAIELIADYILQNNISTWHPTAVWVTSAPLTQVARTKIEKAFSTKVYDQYGSCESFYLAAENPFGEGLSVFSDIKLIEIVDEYGKPQPSGVDGKILITDLENYSFPLIRYDTGDVGKWLPADPADKLPFPRISPVKGRETDYIRLPNNVIISGEYWTTVFDKHPTAVKSFQVTQHKNSSITVQYVLNEANPRALDAIREVEQILKNLIKNCVPIQMKEVSDIPLIRGKRKVVTRE